MATHSAAQSPYGDSTGLVLETPTPLTSPSGPQNHTQQVQQSQRQMQRQIKQQSQQVQQMQRRMEEQSHQMNLMGQQIQSLRTRHAQPDAPTNGSTAVETTAGALRSNEKSELGQIIDQTRSAQLHDEGPELEDTSGPNIAPDMIIIKTELRDENWRLRCDLREKIDAHKAVIRFLRDNVTDSEERIANLEGQLVSLVARNKALERSCAHLQKDLTTEAADHLAELNRLRSELMTSEEALATSARENRELRDQRDEVAFTPDPAPADPASKMCSQHHEGTSRHTSKPIDKSFVRVVPHE
ncbi:hypothetical protein T440DRAFT_512510 [Plenodomus tracheiphilus IPT5]|uniref:Uncharacterized protein n=1 Tax=Plenodomus tracheiphilus IPT5 TaxID=1408161 RepID=A0A6A7BM10_9PLEO|nr:hypothetical protein T440DRAFT_512510 [Plenodomus tracheiphilus IPT5]